MKTKKGFASVLAIIISMFMLTVFLPVTAFADDNGDNGEGDYVADADGDVGNDDGDDAADEASGAAFDPNGTYMAFIQIQSQNWNFRDEWESPTLGASGTGWAANGGEHEGSFNQLFHTDNGVQPGTVVDVELKGNGTYRVSATDLNLADTCETFNILGFSTNIPIEGNPVEFSDVKVIMGGRTVSSFDGSEGNKPIVVGIDSRDNAEYYRVNVINQWNDDLGGRDGLFGYIMPSELAIEFTISGFAYDKVEEAAPEDTADDEAGNDSVAPGGAANDDAGDDADGDGFPLWLIIAIAGGGIIVVVCVIVLATKKKK
jgi:hypothetical protein